MLDIGQHPLCSTHATASQTIAPVTTFRVAFSKTLLVCPPQAPQKKTLIILMCMFIHVSSDMLTSSTQRNPSDGCKFNPSMQTCMIAPQLREAVQSLCMSQEASTWLSTAAAVKPHPHAAVAPNSVVEATRLRNLALQYKSEADRKADRVQMKSRMVGGFDSTT